MDIQKFKELVTQGWGRRRLAEVFGTTEWQVRKLLEEPTAVPVPPSQLKFPAKIAAMGDLHIPYQSRPAVELALKFLKDYRPDYLVLMGDIIDFYGVSRFLKEPARAFTIQQDLDQTVEFLEQVRRALPGTSIYYVEGNHSQRLCKSILSKLPELYYLRNITLPALLDLTRLEIQLIPYNIELNLGPISFIHGDTARKHAGRTAHALFEHSEKNLVVGHVHRLAAVWKRVGSREQVGIEAGHLCDPVQQEYVRNPDWQQGFVIFKAYDPIDFHFELVKINDGRRLVTSNKIYAS